MNNIQKHFKAKRGLCMAQGGMIDPNSVDMSAIASGTVDGNGSDFDTINAERTLRWAQEDAAKRASYGQAATPSMAATDLVRGLGVRQAAPVQPAPVQQQHVDQFREPAPTTFEQDNEARGLRIQGYGADLARMRKDRLGLADGTGNLAQAGQSESAEQVMARMAAKYGVSTQPAAAPTQAPQPVQQAPAAPQRKGLMGAAMGLLRGRHAQIEAATNYAEGGIVRGKGGPTDDEVPMQVAGKDVNLSNSEAVLPVKTVDALGGPEAVEELIEETNGKPPVRGGLRAGGAYEGGVTFGTGKRPTIYNDGGLSAPVVQAGINTMRGQMADARDPRRMSTGAIREVGADLGAVKEDPEALMQRVAKTHGLEYQAPAVIEPPVRFENRPTDPDTDGRRKYSTPTAPSFVHMGGSQPAVKPAGLAAQADYSNEGRAKPQAAVNPISTVARTLVNNTLGKDAAMPQGLRNRWADNDPMKAQQYMGKDNAANGLRNNPADGHGVVSIKQADGKFKNVLMSPSQYTGADGKPTSDWSKTAQFAQGTAQAAKDKASLRDLEYSNAKFNATSDQITDPNARAAGLRALAHYDQEAALAAKVAESNAKAQHDNMQLRLTKRGQDITLRGQDNMQGNSERDAAAAAEKIKQADANTAAELYFTTNDEETGDKIVNYGALGKFNRWRSSFTQNDPRAKLEQAELFRRFMAEQSVKERGAGGSKTELPINHTGQRQAGLRDVFTSGNGVFLPTGRVETFDNGAAIRSSSIPKDEYDTRRLLGLDK